MASACQTGNGVAMIATFATAAVQVRKKTSRTAIIAVVVPLQEIDRVLPGERQVMTMVVSQYPPADPAPKECLPIEGLLQMSHHPTKPMHPTRHYLLLTESMKTTGISGPINITATADLATAKAQGPNLVSRTTSEPIRAFRSPVARNLLFPSPSRTATVTKPTPSSSSPRRLAL